MRRFPFEDLVMLSFAYMVVAVGAGFVFGQKVGFGIGTVYFSIQQLVYYFLFLRD